MSWVQEIWHQNIVVKHQISGGGSEQGKAIALHQQILKLLFYLFGAFLLLITFLWHLFAL